MSMRGDARAEERFAGRDVLQEKGDAAGQLVEVRRAGAALDRDLLLAHRHPVDQAVARSRRRRRRRSGRRGGCCGRPARCAVAGAWTLIAGQIGLRPGCAAGRSRRAGGPCSRRSATSGRERRALTSARLSDDIDDPVRHDDDAARRPCPRGSAAPARAQAPPSPPRRSEASIAIVSSARFLPLTCTGSSTRVDLQAAPARPPARRFRRRGSRGRAPSSTPRRDAASSARS